MGLYSVNGHSAAPSGYKALVVVHLGGGCDSNDILVPLDGGFSDYTKARPGIGLAKSQITSLGTHMGHNMGLNNAMANLTPLFNSKRLAFVVNAGALVKPTTTSDVLNGRATLPPFLYSHPEQTQFVQGWTGDEDPSGWGGRAIEALNPDRTLKAPLIAVNSNDKTLVLGQRSRVILANSGGSKWMGSADLTNPGNHWTQTLASLGRLQSTNHVEAEYARTFKGAFSDAQEIAIAEGVAVAKDLGNLPGNICNPAYFAEKALEMGKEFSFKVDVLERADMEKLGMGSFLSVGRASANPCKLVVMHYQGDEAGKQPVVLVGKGITFDTGGISLKPGANLDEMKFDMGGAGSVMGAMQVVARLGLKLNVVGIIAAAENMPGGDASRPGDVVRSMSGLTIEILNTDAEGRLLLCDALTYAERFNPSCVIDIATLTGACVIALGAHASGLFANDQALASHLLASGTETGDRAWQLPLWDDYMSQLKTNFADISNLGGPPAGAVTAALFLSQFAKAYSWAHIDIAGTGSVSGEAKGSTGRPVPLLADFLIARGSAAA
jgi:leucyl aminopeptidase